MCIATSVRLPKATAGDVMASQPLWPMPPTTLDGKSQPRGAAHSAVAAMYPKNLANMVGVLSCGKLAPYSNHRRSRMAAHAGSVHSWQKTWVNHGPILPMPQDMYRTMRKIWSRAFAPGTAAYFAHR
eukprot:scaffold112302_cov67-Phaeocystis_antarctica.AAC.4